MKFLTLTILSGFFATAHAAGLDDFIITVQTNNPGTSADTEFTIPTTDSGYNYNVDCNDDGVDDFTAQTGDVTCDYSALGGAGTYRIRLTRATTRVAPYSMTMNHGVKSLNLLNFMI